MKNNIYIYFSLLFCLLFLQTVVRAQETKATVTLKENQLRIVFITEMRGADNAIINRSFDTYVYVQGQRVIHRLMIDEVSGLYFGYDFEIELDSTRKSFKISIKPLSAKFKSLDKLEKYSSSPLLKYPEPQVLKEGEKLKLGLLENPQTKARISDLIQVSTISQETANSSYTVSISSGSNDSSTANPNLSKSSNTSVGSGANKSTGEGRDFSPEAIELRLQSLQLYMNDKKMPREGNQTYVIERGEFVYVYVPGKGRFVISLAPVPNYDFKKIGTVEKNEISFTADKIVYRLTSEISVLEFGGKWNIWILHEPEYKSQRQFSPSRTYEVGTVILKR